MRLILLALAIVALALVYFAGGSPAPLALPRATLPVATLGNGLPRPEVGLLGPLPDWIPLPETGRVFSAGLYPPQPPYGPAAVIMLEIDVSAEAFVPAYVERRRQAGFASRRYDQPSMPWDRPDMQFEAKDATGAHVIYITMRHGYDVRMAQLTYWSAPVPTLF